MQKSIFSKAERNAVEDKFGGDIIYKSLRGTTLRLMNGATAFRLSPEELFYLVCFELDSLKGMEHNEMVAYCNYDVWAELYNYFVNEKEIEDADKDIDLACVTILRAVGELLFRSREKEYYDAASALLRTVIQHISADFCRSLDGEFLKGFSSVDEDNLTKLISDYLHGATNYSEDIDALLDSIESGVKDAADYDMPTSGIRIANGKKTSVMVVLNAMYKAGWLVGEDGKVLTNRNKALNEILKFAFNDECDSIPQLLKPTNCTDLEVRNEKIFKELREKM